MYYEYTGEKNCVCYGHYGIPGDVHTVQTIMGATRVQVFGMLKLLKIKLNGI
jgi:hypothetical protein